MTNPSEIWLIRHGQTEWTLTGQHTGRSDLPLTTQGELEARATAGLLNHRAFELVLCSPLRRAVQTCEISGYIERARLEPAIMEWDYGDLNGRTGNAIRAEMPGWNIWDGPVPGGETLEEVAQRARGVLDGIGRTSGTVALFSHGHFLRIFTTQFLGWAPLAARGLALGTGAVCVLGFEGGFPAILRWNLTPPGVGQGH